jgi:hypothetical protein
MYPTDGTIDMAFSLTRMDSISVGWGSYEAIAGSLNRLVCGRLLSFGLVSCDFLFVALVPLDSALSYRYAVPIQTVKAATPTLSTLLYSRMMRCYALSTSTFIIRLRYA